MGIIDFITKLTGSQKKAVFDPAIFENSLARQVLWTPLKRGGSNFKTKKLQKISKTELNVKGTNKAKVFAITFMLLPLIFIGFIVFELQKVGLNFSAVFLIVPLLFMGIGLYNLRKFSHTFVLDKTSGYFYKNSKTSIVSLNPNEDKNTFKLSTIKGIQILSERVKSKNRSYLSYELNLVFEDGNRYNLMDHASQNGIEQDAITIGDFLGIPVWNKVTGTSYTPNSAAISDSYNSLEKHETRQKPVQSEYASTFEEPSDNNKDSLSQDLDAPYDSTKPRKM